MPMTFDPHAFADWCREKPVEMGYSGVVANHCALAQFGFPGVQSYRLRGVPLAILQAAATRPFTFGALADRLAKMGY